MILTLDDVKTQLRLELSFTEHDELLTRLIAAAQRSIEREYYCRLVSDADELDSLPENVVGYIADEDVQLAMKYLVNDAYLNGHTGEWLETQAVKSLLFSLMEHTV